MDKNKTPAGLNKLHKKYKHHKLNNPQVGRVQLMEKLKRHYLMTENYEEVLTDEELNILKRLKTAWSLLMKHQPIIKPMEVARVLADLFGVTERQGFYDVRMAQDIFGDIMATNRAFARVKYVSWLEDIVSLCNTKHDFQSSINALQLLYKMLRLDQADEQEDTSPRSFQLNILVTTKDGTKRVIEDLDALDEIPLSDFTEIHSTLSQPRVDVLDMDKLLDEA